MVLYIRVLLLCTRIESGSNFQLAAARKNVILISTPPAVSKSCIKPLTYHTSATQLDEPPTNMIHRIIGRNVIIEVGGWLIELVLNKNP